MENLKSLDEFGESEHSQPQDLVVKQSNPVLSDVDIPGRLFMALASRLRSSENK